MKQVEMMWKILFIYENLLEKSLKNIFNCNHRALKEKKAYCSVWNLYSRVYIYNIFNKELKIIIQFFKTI